MSLKSNKFHHHEMLKEVTSVVGEKIEPRDLGAKKDESMIMGIIMGGAGGINRSRKSSREGV